MRLFLEFSRYTYAFDLKEVWRDHLWTKETFFFKNKFHLLEKDISRCFEFHLLGRFGGTASGPRRKNFENLIAFVGNFENFIAFVQGGLEGRPLDQGGRRGVGDRENGGSGLDLSLQPSFDAGGGCLCFFVILMQNFTP